MKILALLAMLIALPLAAEAPAPTPLTQAEHEKISLYYMQLQNAQIALYQAREAWDTGMKELASEHGACPGGQWSIPKKEWNCPKKPE